MKSPKSHRIFDSVFLEFISSPILNHDFEKLKEYLKLKSGDTDDFINNFLQNSCFEVSPRKPVPLSPNKISCNKTPVKKTYNEKFSFKSSSDETIPMFFPVRNDDDRSILISLYRSTDVLDLKSLENVLVKYLNIPSFFTIPFMNFLGASDDMGIRYSKFLEFSIQRLECFEFHERIFNLLLGNNRRNYLIHDDFILYIDSLIKEHKSLEFLHGNRKCQEAFRECIIARIFFELDPEMRGRITLSRFVNSNLCDCFIEVDSAEDISDIFDFFSYEHFYVIYTLFIEIDIEDNGTITIDQLSTYDNNRIPYYLCERIVQQFPNAKEIEKLTIYEFTYFLIAVEDKTKETSLRLWFNSCDFDQDGIISLHEMHELYNEQKERMIDYDMEPIKFKYIFSELIDMFGDNIYKGFTMDQLREKQQWSVFFDIFVDIKKFNEREFQDPIYEQKNKLHTESMKKWDIFCDTEYQRLSV